MSETDRPIHAAPSTRPCPKSEANLPTCHLRHWRHARSGRAIQTGTRQYAGFGDRRALSERTLVLNRVLTSARAVGLDLPAGHKLARAFAALDGLSESRALPAETDNPFGRSWQPLIDQPDRSAALKRYTAATAMLLKRALNNRSVTAKESLLHKSTEARLIPPAMWRRDVGAIFATFRSRRTPNIISGVWKKPWTPAWGGISSIFFAIRSGMSFVIPQR